MCERDVNFIEVFMRNYYDAGYNFKCKTKSFFLAIIFSNPLITNSIFGTGSIIRTKHVQPTKFIQQTKPIC